MEKIEKEGIDPPAEALRVKFFRQMLLRISDIPYIIWTDETSFWLNKANPLYGWVSIENEIKHDPLVNLSREKVNLWGAMCANGRISLYLFEEKLTPLFLGILKKKIREMRASYPEGFFFMSDNDSKHTSDMAIEYINENFMDHIAWPSYSLDLNPLENIWAWLKRRVSQDMPEDLNSLKNAIRRHWRQITAEMILPCIDSLEKRFREVISQKAKRIKV